MIKKLLQKDYKFDCNFYGALNEFSRKVAYFFHASLQGSAAYPGAAAALRHVKRLGVFSRERFGLRITRHGYRWLRSRAGGVLRDRRSEADVRSS